MKIERGRCMSGPSILCPCGLQTRLSDSDPGFPKRAARVSQALKLTHSEFRPWLCLRCVLELAYVVNGPGDLFDSHPFVR